MNAPLLSLAKQVISGQKVYFLTPIAALEQMMSWSIKRQVFMLLDLTSQLFLYLGHLIFLVSSPATIYHLISIHLVFAAVVELVVICGVAYGSQHSGSLYSWASQVVHTACCERQDVQECD
jgi:hypothetical protein